MTVPDPATTRATRTLSSLLQYREPTHLSLNSKHGLLEVSTPGAWYSGRLTNVRALIYCGELFPYHPPSDRFAFDPPPHDSLGELDHRSLYLHALENKLDDPATPPADLEALAWEKRFWRDLDELRLKRIVLRNVFPAVANLHDLRELHDVDWQWASGAPQHAGTPAVYFGRSQHVPVHRLLWTSLRSKEPLLRDTDDGRLIKLHPRRMRDRCHGMECVNPFHFEYAEPFRAGRDVIAISGGNWAQAGVLGSKMYHIPYTRTWPDGIARCLHGHEFRASQQAKYQRMQQEGTPWVKLYCADCNSERIELGVRAPRRPRKGQAVHPNLVRDAQQMWSGMRFVDPEQDKSQPEVKPPTLHGPGYEDYTQEQKEDIKHLFDDLMEDNPA